MVRDIFFNSRYLGKTRVLEVFSSLHFMYQAVEKSSIKKGIVNYSQAGLYFGLVSIILVMLVIDRYVPAFHISNNSPRKFREKTRQGV